MNAGKKRGQKESSARLCNQTGLYAKPARKVGAGRRIGQDPCYHRRNRRRGADRHQDNGQVSMQYFDISIAPNAARQINAPGRFLREFA